MIIIIIIIIIVIIMKHIDITIKYHRLIRPLRRGTRSRAGASA